MAFYQLCFDLADAGEVEGGARRGPGQLKDNAVRPWAGHLLGELLNGFGQHCAGLKRNR
ncbi:hypothetical protein [Bradyrhizobium sp. CCBAU 45384]|uniref:hypothetical protein n=1 Tax=Bradyrhizobium sp. CCBAU 45384 TaxID=858428 RepID=UPI0023062107|nr:hypothetical protein [Bradyrhizobium sp. CCBAU 45384]